MEGQLLESDRLAELVSYEILETPSEAPYNELVQLASSVCGTPIAVISLLDRDREWFKAQIGLKMMETPRDTSFATHVIKANSVFVIEDALKTSVFNLNPLVIHDPNIRFYAGCPLITESGAALGTLSVLDQKPRQMTQDMTAALTILAKQVMAHFELRRTRGTMSSLIERQAETSKMTALGEMATSLAHEINNPIAVIQGRVEYLLLQARKNRLENSEAIEYANQILTTTQRVSKIIKGIKAFAADGERELHDRALISDIVEDTTAFCLEKFKNHGIRFEVSNIPQDLAVRCSSVQICQVLLNLLNNAFDAVKGVEGRRIDLKVKSQESEALIIVTDNGPGIPESIQEKIFTPFFTTKKVGHGTGMGLSISKRIIDRHHGQLTVESHPQSTVFTIRLPKC